MAHNPLPLMTPPDAERWAELPPHWVPVPYSFCIYCGEPQLGSFVTYEEYTNHFWAFEYEGARGHVPEDRESFEYVRDTCLA